MSFTTTTHPHPLEELPEPDAEPPEPDPEAEPLPDALEDPDGFPLVGALDDELPPALVLCDCGDDEDDELPPALVLCDCGDDEDDELPPALVLCDCGDDEDAELGNEIDDDELELLAASTGKFVIPKLYGNVCALV